MMKDIFKKYTTVVMQSVASLGAKELNWSPFAVISISLKCRKQTHRTRREEMEVEYEEMTEEM